LDKYSLILHKIYWNIKEERFISSIMKLLNGIWREIFQGSEHLFCLDLSKFPGNESPVSHDVQIDTFTKKEEMPEYILYSLKGFVQKKGMKEEFMNYYLEKILNTYKDGGKMYVAKVNNKLAAYLWSITEKGNYTPYFSLFPLAPGDTLLFGGLTAPPYRGQGLVPMLIRHGANLAKKDGKKRIFATCKVSNRSSFRCIIKAGLKEITVARGLTVFGRRIVLWAKNGYSRSPS
jgi:RimJ/RimL family protein N-acetyltransferase